MKSVNADGIILHVISGNSETPEAKNSCLIA